MLHDFELQSRMTGCGRFLSIAPQHIRTARRTSPKGSERPDPTHCGHSSTKLSTSAFGEAGIPIYIEICQQFRRTAKVVASIEDPVVIEKLFPHLNEKAHYSLATLLPENRRPPQAGLFDRG
jgi:hypothetical protein